MAWNYRNAAPSQPRSQPAPHSKRFYLDYYANSKNPKFMEVVFRVFGDKAKPSDNEIERVITRAHESGTLQHNKRVFASARLPVDQSNLVTETDLDDIYGLKAVVTKISRSLLWVNTPDKEIKLPNYTPRDYRIDDEVIFSMPISTESIGTTPGRVLAVVVGEANAELAEILPGKTIDGSERSPELKRYVMFLDSHFVSTIEKYPSTIGVERLMIQSQRLLFPNKEFWTNQIRELEPKFSSWRKSRGDGNCYYRAVSVSFVESMLRYGKISELKKIYDRLLFQDDYTVPPGFENHHYYFLKCFGTFINNYQQSDRIVMEFQKLELDYAFDNAMIGVFRSLAACWLEKNQGHDEIFPFIMDTGVGPILREILTDEHEGEGLAFVAMANVLCAKVHHIIVDQNAAKTHTETFAPFSGQFDVEFSLLLRPGHYDLIYMRDFDEKDRYDLHDQRFR